MGNELYIRFRNLDAKERDYLFKKWQMYKHLTFVEVMNLYLDEIAFEEALPSIKATDSDFDVF